MMDPHIQGVLEAMAQSGFALPDPITPASLRGALDNPIPGPAVDIAQTRDIVMEEGGIKLPARLYHPAPGETLPVTVFFHGGGWVHGTLDMYDRLCASLAVQSQCAVVSVDYRLAPENPFPAAFKDALMSIKWVKANQAGLGVDARRIAIAGDSSGGNLAAATAQALADDPAICHQLLLYPALDARCATASYESDIAGFLSPEQMRWYWSQYAPGNLHLDPRASPALSVINPNMAPATIIVAGNDPLHDEGVAYAEALKAHGAQAILHEYSGAIHGFVSLLGLVPIADKALNRAAEALQTAFSA